MMNKKGVLPRDILISIVLFGMFIGGLFLITGEMFSSYGIPTTYNSTVYNKIADISTQTDTMRTAIENSGTSVVGDILLFPKGVWESIKLVLSSGGIIGSVVNSISTDYGIPSIFTFGFITIVMITIIFGILSAIMRKKT